MWHPGDRVLLRPDVHETYGENAMKISTTSGASLAAVAAAMLLAGAVSAPSANAADEAMGHCVGANACKGHSACKSASNACKGENACKGQGFTETTKEDCAKVEGGKFEMPK